MANRLDSPTEASPRRVVGCLLFPGLNGPAAFVSMNVPPKKSSSFSVSYVRKNLINSILIGLGVEVPSTAIIVFVDTHDR